jgi:hypothetical protein
MSIIPNNTDPLKDYVTPNANPPLTINGLVFNKIYGYTGVIDSLNNTNSSYYNDPTINTSNTNNGLLSVNKSTNTYWISNSDFGGNNSAPVILTYNLVNTTYYNNISFDALNVPCFIEILDNNGNNLPGTSTFTIAGGDDIFTRDNWIRLNYNAPTNPYPATVSGSGGTSTFSYPLTGSNNIKVRITRNKQVQTNSAAFGISNVAYSVGLQNFRIKLDIKSLSDIPSTVASGTKNIITQNSFGFVESYSYITNNQSNMFVNDSTYWKCSPQPTKDSVVFFYAKINDPTPTVINRLYIDPIYSGCKFNVYYTTQTTSGGTIDPGTFTWTPLQRDFSLRKGIYKIPRISCTYIKFEFTSLNPEAYDLPFDSINRTINVFPYDVEQYYENLEQSIANSNAVKYSTYGNANLKTQTQNNNQLSASTIFGVSNNTIGSQSNWQSLSQLNTTQLGSGKTTGLSTSSQIFDPSISYKLIDINGNYNQTSFTQFLQRRFYNTRVHNYSTININQTWHQAYFVGIRFINFFYEQRYDDLQSIPGQLVAKNTTTSGFVAQDVNYVGLNPDETATTPWFSTFDTFTSFNIAGLTTDWRSFITQGASLNQDPTILNGPVNGNLSPSQLSSMVVGYGTTPQYVGKLGSSSIYSVSGTTSGQTYGIKSIGYNNINNLLKYYDANFFSTNGNWYGLASTSVTGASVNWSQTISGATYSGTASGITVSGGSYVAAYNFTLPNVYSPSGTTPWTTQLGSPSLGVVGFASYVPATGINYYFLTNLQSTGTQNVTMYTRFINASTSGVIANTTVTGNTVSLSAASGSTVLTATGTNYNSSIPSNTIQVVLSGSATVPYQVYQAGAFSTPTTQWVSPSDRTNMRVSGVARMFLPVTNNGTYRISLYATNTTGAIVEIAYKVYQGFKLPLNTWFDVELFSYTTTNYTSFYTQIQQTNTAVNEQFYISMLAPFYHPIRYEYITQSGATNWQPIIYGVNDPHVFISTVSGVPASGIQVRMTALDPNVYISGVSVVPYYKQNSYYAGLDINYIGNGKSNEWEARVNVANKPYFQLNKEYYPTSFAINNIASTVTPYILR